MSLELQGKIKKIGKTQTFGANNFAKRDLWLTTVDGNYEQHIPIEFHQDNVDHLDNVKVGQEIKVHINLKGRLWTSPQGEEKCFGSIVGWKIESLQPQQASAPAEKAPQEPANEEDTDDLPF